MRFIASLIVLVFTASVSFAESPKWSFSTEVWSKYVAGPNGLVSYKQPVLQANLNASWSNCAYVNIWASKALGSGSGRDNFGNEGDYTLGCAKTLANGIAFDASLSYYDLSSPTLFKTSRGDIVQPAIEVS